MLPSALNISAIINTLSNSLLPLPVIPVIYVCLYLSTTGIKFSKLSLNGSRILSLIRFSIFSSMLSSNFINSSFWLKISQSRLLIAESSSAKKPKLSYKFL